MSEKPVFSARVQGAHKLAIEGYICPLCSDTFSADGQLWGHAKTEHGQQLGLALLADDAKAREHFIHKATTKAYVGTSRLSRLPLDTQAWIITFFPMNLVDGPSF